MNFGVTEIFSPLHMVREMIKEKTEQEEGDRIVIRRDWKSY